MKPRESWLQNGISIYKMGFLSYKRDSRLAIYQDITILAGANNSSKTFVLLVC